MAGWFPVHRCRPGARCRCGCPRARAGCRRRQWRARWQARHRGGQASPRGSQPWSQRVYATWALGEATVLMSDGQSLRTSAYERSDAGNRTSMWWQVPGYRVELTFSTQRSGTETSAGSGALRMFSGAAGDSISVPVRVDEGC